MGYRHAKTLTNSDDPLYRVVVDHLDPDGTVRHTAAFGAFTKLGTAKQQASYRLNEATRNGRKARVRVDALILIPHPIHKEGYEPEVPE